MHALIEQIIPAYLYRQYNEDPNQRFPGTTWKNIGENRTIRLASANGSDVMKTGGSDSVTLAVNNLPAHGHTFSANTSDFDHGSKQTNGFDYGWKQTDEQGNHEHTYNEVIPRGASGMILAVTGKLLSEGMLRLQPVLTPITYIQERTIIG